MKPTRSRPGRRVRGQSLIEFALGGLLLIMFLAAAVDIGRAYFTWVAVQQMAGEGANYLSFAPDADLNYQPPPTDLNQTFQRRAQYVAARNWGSVIDPNKVTSVTTDVNFAQRCRNVPFTVSVNYNLDDLFFPAFLGLRTLNLGASEQARFSVDGDPGCPP